MPKKTSRKNFLIFLVVFFSFLLPLFLLLIVIIIFRETGLKLPPEISEPAIEALSPSQVLNNKMAYNQQKIILRGRIGLDPVVCERKNCPPDDRCCGCPPERTLYIVDPESFLIPRSEGRLKLLNNFNQSFCQRKPSRCQYDCQDWIEGAVYNVGGTFFAETPPPGLKISLDYFFRVENKNLVRRVGFSEFLGNISMEIRQIINQLKSSGYYVIP